MKKWLTTGLSAGLSVVCLAGVVLSLGGCGGSSDVYVAATELVTPVEKPLGAPVVIITPNHDDNTKSDSFSATFFLKIDKRDETVYDALFPTRKNEIREKVALLILQATPAERQDPTLYEIKHRIVDVVNDLLGAEFVKEVIVTDVTAITFQN
ncbi:MAG: hypothetical protein ACRC46_08820 [Thermoguttaceae bacterium]